MESEKDGLYRANKIILEQAEHIEYLSRELAEKTAELTKLKHRTGGKRVLTGRFTTRTDLEDFICVAHFEGQNQSRIAGDVGVSQGLVSKILKDRGLR